MRPGRRQRVRLAPCAAFLLGAVVAAGGAAPVEKGGGTMALTISSTAFPAGGTIPVRHTCDGEDVSPDLAWTEPPPGTRSFALIVDDPDAPVGTWVHWVLYDVPAGARSVPAAVPKTETLAEPAGAKQGRNDFGRIGWGGPCPPRGSRHRYFFRLYALDCLLELPPGATRGELDRAMRGHVLAQAEVHGTYARKGS